MLSRSRGYLPHNDPQTATYFLTFRLADSFAGKHNERSVNPLGNRDRLHPQHCRSHLADVAQSALR